MTTLGRSLPHVPGRSTIAFTGDLLQKPQTVTLDSALYFITLSQKEPAYPTGVTITDAMGNVVNFTGHGIFTYMVGSFAQNPIVISLTTVTATNPAGNGIDQFQMSAVPGSDDTHTGGMGSGKGNVQNTVNNQ